MISISVTASMLPVLLPLLSVAIAILLVCYSLFRVCTYSLVNFFFLLQSVGDQCFLRSRNL